MENVCQGESGVRVCVIMQPHSQVIFDGPEKTGMGMRLKPGSRFDAGT